MMKLHSMISIRRLRRRWAPLRTELSLFLYAIWKSPSAKAGLFIVGIYLLIVLLGPMLAPYDPYKIDIEGKLTPPSMEHLFGTDSLGRDVFSRVLHGALISLRVGFIVVSIGSSIGVLLGAIAAYKGGIVETVIMRITDVFLSIPAFLLAMAVASALGPSIENVIVALTVIWWPGFVRLTHSQILTIRESAYIEASRLMGAGSTRIIFRHVIPNAISPVLVGVTTGLGYVIIWSAGLSFVGFGAQPPIPEWGVETALGRSYLHSAWWWSVFPGTAILLACIGFNLLGDGIRDALDPRLRRQLERR